MAFSIDRVRPPHATLLPSCPLMPAPGVGPHAPQANGGQRWMPPAGRRLAPQRTDRMGGWRASLHGWSCSGCAGGD